jgi:uncharacterized DUF497 family protein
MITGLIQGVSNNTLVHSNVCTTDRGYGRFKMGFDGKVWIGNDIKHSQNEERLMAIGKSENKFILIIFTRRTSTGKKLIRPISARAMHRKEITRYEEEITEMENR